MSRVSRLLNSSVEIWREQRVDDGGGGWETSWALLATVRARLSQPSAAERRGATEQGDQSQARLTHVVYVEPGTDVAFGDQLRQAGRTLFVLATYEPSGPGTYLRVDCTARQPDTGGV